MRLENPVWDVTIRPQCRRTRAQSRSVLSACTRGWSPHRATTLDLARHLAPAASGVLIDAYYGAWSSVASGAIGPQTGLLVRVEMSGSPKNKVGAPLGLIEPGWSVEKIKRMGADAVKLLAQFEPTEPLSAEHQFQLIEHVYTECKKHDILMLLETVAFPFGGEKKTDASFLNRKAATVIESARQLSRFCDVYKAEFPGTMGHESDNQLRDNLRALECGQRTAVGAAYRRASIIPTTTSRCRWPWAPAPRESWEVERSGRSTSSRTGAAAHSQFAATTALKRVADVNTLVREHGTPWYARYGLTKENLAAIRATEGWHARYGSALGSTQGTASSKGRSQARCTDQALATQLRRSALLGERHGCGGGPVRLGRGD